MAIICLLYEAGLRLFDSYMREVCGYVSVLLGRMTLFVIYMRQIDGYLSVTSGRLKVIC